MVCRSAENNQKNIDIFFKFYFETQQQTQFCHAINNIKYKTLYIIFLNLKIKLKKKPPEKLLAGC
jgi:hypothetical protein